MGITLQGVGEVLAAVLVLEGQHAEIHQAVVDIRHALATASRGESHSKVCARPLPRFLCLRASMRKSTKRLSKSLPPERGSSAVAFTTKIPSSLERNDSSNVPTPMS